MAERSFFGDEARAQAKAVVEEIEKQTSAEVVVVLRRQSGSYRDADFLGGAGVALAATVALLALPWTFALYAVPVDLVAAFALGAFLCSRSPGFRRLVTSRRRRRTAVRDAARTVFVDQGISRTSGRWGVLVYASMLERDVELVPDIGVRVEGFEEEWLRIAQALRRAVERGDFHSFREALNPLGPLLGKLHPRHGDDVNELPDEVSAQ